ncbi:MAG TPA: hypothetical protein VE714_05135, partial [Gemmatimonadales bacterium]|nr:hypothetical protein [Gemmatimonadales bacterium]
SANVAHLGAVMDAFGLAGRWAYRDEVSGRCFGLAEREVRDVCRGADVFVNLSCSTFMRDEYRAIPVRVLIDTDPMFTQIQYVTQTAFTSGKPGLRDLVEAHSHLFTFGEQVGEPECRIPACGREWRPTRQPICLDYWRVTELPPRAEAAYTTVMNWSAAPPLQYDGELWGQKNVEFLRIMALPSHLPHIRLAVAVGQTMGVPFPQDEARARGWTVLQAEQCVPNWSTYRDFIERSLGEFSVAKQTYVRGRTGWFSCRSACYLASGRPVVAQDTGWTRYLPSGRGLLAFENAATAAEALACVDADLSKHARAARRLAAEHFASEVVLGELLREVGG